eukprot:SAG31_NODE_1251_length_9110_cov_5.844412_5_plen_193_part_00
MSMHKEMVSRVPLFKAAEEKFISDVVVRVRQSFESHKPCKLSCASVYVFLQLTPQINMPGDTIIVEGERGDRMFFVSSGQVEVVNRDDLVLKVLSRGDYVGELALLSDEPRAASAMARTFCELQVTYGISYAVMIDFHSCACSQGIDEGTLRRDNQGLAKLLADYTAHSRRARQEDQSTGSVQLRQLAEDSE